MFILLDLLADFAFHPSIFAYLVVTRLQPLKFNEFEINLFMLMRYHMPMDIMNFASIEIILFANQVEGRKAKSSRKSNKINILLKLFYESVLM